jgi:hypothetical protein
MGESDLTELLIAAIAAAQRAGSPVPGGDPTRWKRITRIAIQRWRTFPRRHPVPAADTPACRTEDLARGLLARCALLCQTPALGITDYRAFAAHLAPVLAATSSAARTHRQAPGLLRARQTAP